MCFLTVTCDVAYSELYIILLVRKYNSAVRISLLLNFVTKAHTAWGLGGFLLVGVFN